MAATIAAFKMSEFKTWLNEQLRQLNTDESVFGAYIIGILEGEEETQDEKIEALEGILSGTEVSRNREKNRIHIATATYRHPT